MNPEIEQAAAAAWDAGMALGAVIGGGVGAVIGSWTQGSYNNSSTVNERIGYVNTNVSSPDRDDFISKATTLLGLLENSG